MLTLLALIFIVVLSGAKAFFDALHETRKLRFVDPKGARDASDTFSSDFIRSLPASYASHAASNSEALDGVEEGLVLARNTAVLALILAGLALIVVV
jgi:hypothetical protein